MAKSPKFLHLKGNRGRGTWWWHQILEWKWKYSHFAHAQWKKCNVTLIYAGIAGLSASLRKSGLRTRLWCKILDRKWKCGHNYRNGSFIVYMAIGLIPSSTEHISSLLTFFWLMIYNLCLLRRKVCDEWSKSFEFQSISDKTARAYLGLSKWARSPALVQSGISQTKRWYDFLWIKLLFVKNQNVVWCTYY